MRIGIFGHYGNGNLGDEAIIDAAITSARKRLDATDVILFSIVPEDSAVRHGLQAYPIRKGRRPCSPPTGPAEGVMNFVESEAPADTSRQQRKERFQADIQQDAGEKPERSRTSLRDFLKRVPLLRKVVQMARFGVKLPVQLYSEFAFLKQSIVILKDFDLMVVAGSNQFLDNFGGVWGFPYTLLKWTILCRLRHVAVVFLSIGAGPIDGMISKAMVRAALRLGRFHSYRDFDSLCLIEGTQAAMGGVIYPDLACNLEFPCRPNVFEETESIRVAINPMPVYAPYWFIEDDAKYKSYLSKLTEFIAFLEDRGCRITLFPTQTKDTDAIRDALQLLEENHPGMADNIAVENPQNTQELMEVIQTAHIVVPTRFHGTVLSLLANRLVLGVCYQKKAATALESADQGDFAYMLDEFVEQDLIDGYEALLKERDINLYKIERASERVRSEVDDQYRRVKNVLNAT